MGALAKKIFKKLEYNGLQLCVRWGFPSLKLNSSNNFKYSTNVK